MIAPGCAVEANSSLSITVGAANVPAAIQNGMGFESDGSLCGDTGAPAGSFYCGGFRMSAAGALYVKDATDSSDIFIQGVRCSTLGQVIYEASAPNNYQNGNPQETDGSLSVG